MQIYYDETTGFIKTTYGGNAPTGVSPVITINNPPSDLLNMMSIISPITNKPKYYVENGTLYSNTSFTPLTVSIVSQETPTLSTIGQTTFNISSTANFSSQFLLNNFNISLQSNTNYTLYYPYNSAISLLNTIESFPVIKDIVLAQSILSANLPTLSSFNYSVSGNNITAIPTSLQVNYVISALKQYAGSYINYANLIYNLSSLIGIPESFVIATLSNADVSDINEIISTAISKATTTTNPTLAQVNAINSLLIMYGLTTS